MNCKNCYENLNGNFCSNCGQRSRVDKINYKYLISELNTSFFQVEHGLFFTIKKLFLSPGKSIRDFIDGKRKPYFKPIAYVLLLSTIYALVASLISENTILEDALEGWNRGYKEASSIKHETTVLNWFVKNYAYTTLLLLPAFSLASYISFYKSKFNYFEHLILNSYLTGQQALIYIFFISLKSVFGEGDLTSSLPSILSLIFVFWAYIEFFGIKKVYKTILLTILTYLIYIAIISILLAVTILITSHVSF